MQTRALILLLLLLPAGSMAQISINYSTHAIRATDTNEYREIQYADPGNAGAGQVWNFSSLQFTGNEPVSVVSNPTLPKMNGVSDYNLLLSDNGYDYFMNLTTSGLVETGYVNTEKKLLLRYSDPVLKMKYPFAFGEQFTDHFSATAWYGDASAIQFNGDCVVSADAYGKLILQDQVMENVLRIKSVKQGLHVNACGTTDVSLVKYSWYAPGYRYPVLNISIVEASTNGAAPVVTKTAFINTTQQLEKKGNVTMIGSIGATAEVAAETEIKVLLSPNPFVDNVNYSYVLDKARTVSIDLYDLAGKYNGWIINNQLQTAGLQNGVVNASYYGLTPGVYCLRFTFDQKTVIYKIVKL
jgi:hypothetical protein